MSCPVSIASTALEKNGWKEQEDFYASTTLEEKVCRVANIAAFGSVCFGILSKIRGRRIGLIPRLGMVHLQRKALSSLIGYISYPIAGDSQMVTGRSYLKEIFNEGVEEVEQQGFHVRLITLHKSGTSYSAVMITNKDSEDSGHWIVDALGRRSAFEYFIRRKAIDCKEFGVNILIVNGPSVCDSGGVPTRYQMGAGFEAALQFLEKEVKASHILMRGFSLGGGMMAEAILNHDFEAGLDKGIEYLSVADRSFSKLSAVAKPLSAEMAGGVCSQLVRPLFKLSGAELDGLGAARRLSDLGIRHVVIQHISEGSRGTDGIIPDNVSLSHGMHQMEGLTDKVYIESENMPHNGKIPSPQHEQLCQEIHKFFSSGETEHEKVFQGLDDGGGDFMPSLEGEELP